MRHIAAATLDGADYPAYVSVTSGDDPNSDVTIEVRSARIPKEEVGIIARITLNRRQFRMLALGMANEAILG